MLSSSETAQEFPFSIQSEECEIIDSHIDTRGINVNSDSEIINIKTESEVTNIISDLGVNNVNADMEMTNVNSDADCIKTSTSTNDMVCDDEILNHPVTKNTDRNKLYLELYSAYIKRHSSKTKQVCQEEVNKIWNKIKVEEKDDDLIIKVNTLVKELEAAAKMKKGTMMSFWAQQTLKPKTVLPQKLSTNIPTSRPDMLIEVNSSPLSRPTNLLMPIVTAEDSKKCKAKVQQELQNKIDLLKSDMVGLYKRKESGCLTALQAADLKSKKIQLTELEKQLKIRKLAQERQQKSRDFKKNRMAEICESNPEISKTLKIRGKVGRPAVEVDQPLFLKAIIDIAIYGSAAHERRQSDIYRSIRTLDELTDQLNKDGFQVCRSTVYTRLMPKRSSSLEGKRHIVTVPVKLIKAHNDSHTKHIDGLFCISTINRLEELSSMLGPNDVCFISQDDKARVPIGLTAANKQAPLLMHVEYKITLPDHDWVVAASHKLIPSVYAGIVIKKDGLGKPDAVTYSGPTYIAIRSGKHSSSTAYAHGLDFERLLQLPEFDCITKDSCDKVVKPVVVFSVDGGPDENPRYQKVIDVAIHHFLKHNIDALFIVTNAPGRSAFNRVERRMAPLSRELFGLILPHEHFGSHLDSQGRTIDANLEKVNFKFAGETLSKIWSEVIIDQFPIVSEYVDPEKSELSSNILLSKDIDWFYNHVRTSQYFTQIVKCFDTNCCQKVRSSYFNAVPVRFFPPPIPINQTSEGLKAADRTDTSSQNFPSLFIAQILNTGDESILSRSTRSFQIIPYDLYCPSVQSLLIERICKKCHIYFASQAILRKHYAQHKTQATLGHDTVNPSRPIRPVRIAARRQRELMAVIARRENEDVEWLDEEYLDLAGISVPEERDTSQSIVPIISMEEHLDSPWEESS